ALQIVAHGAAEAAHADVVVARVESRGRAAAVALATPSQALAAELSGSSIDLGELPQQEQPTLELASPGVQKVAQRAGAFAVLVLPVHVDGHLRGSLELYRRDAFDDVERRFARLSAAQASLAIR